MARAKAAGGMKTSKARTVERAAKTSRRKSEGPKRIGKSARMVVLEAVADSITGPAERSRRAKTSARVRTTPTRKSRIRPSKPRSGLKKLSNRVEPTEPTLDTYLERLDSRSREIIERLRGIVHEAAPKASEALRWGEPCWELNGLLCYVTTAKNHVTFGFFHGASLKDERGVLSNTGRGERVIKLRTVDEIPAPELKKLIQRAARSNINR
jgi:hypothetical protein